MLTKSSSGKGISKTQITALVGIFTNVVFRILSWQDYPVPMDLQVQVNIAIVFLVQIFQRQSTGSKAMT